jgi:proton glutamate symport protein
MKKLPSLAFWVFAGMLVGIVLGIATPGFAYKLGPLSTLFLRLLRSIIAPLLFGTLVTGIAGSGSVGSVGRVGLKAVIYFEIVTTLALLIGLGAVNLVRPGDGIDLRSVASPVTTRTAAPTFAEIIEHSVPASVIAAMANGDVLPLVVFTLLFGAACSALGEKARPVVNFAEALAEVMLVYTRYVMYLAPLGVGAALAVTMATQGVSVIGGLGRLIVTMLAALLVFTIAVLLPAAYLFGVPLRRFGAAVREPALLAFSTASSESALPRALENMERFGVPKHIVGLVIPLGYSLNLDGSTLYLALASIFVAQAANIELSWTQQALMLVTLMITSKGVAGLPKAAFVILGATLASFGLPAEGVALLLGVDAILDMARTTVNVVGNCLASAVVARWEGSPLETPNPLDNSV